ncbi:MAG: GNAT family N-acetyltransferase [Kofleriaceae bacterium]
MIRGATAADYDGFAKLFRELGYPGPTPSPHRWTTDLVRSTLVADRGGAVAGYIDFYALSEAGHVRNLVVAREARNTGVGADLMRAAADQLRAHGIREWHLNVKRDNMPAVHLYEKLGMQIEHRSTVFRVPWTLAGTLPCDPAVASRSAGR